MTEQKQSPFDNTTEIVCEACKNNTFVQVLYLRQKSAILSSTGVPEVAMIPTLACSKCDHINEIFQPKAIKSNIVA